MRNATGGISDHHGGMNPLKAFTSKGSIGKEFNRMLNSISVFTDYLINWLTWGNSYRRCRICSAEGWWDF